MTYTIEGFDSFMDMYATVIFFCPIWKECKMDRKGTMYDMVIFYLKACVYQIVL